MSLAHDCCSPVHDLQGRSLIEKGTALPLEEEPHPPPPPRLTSIGYWSTTHMQAVVLQQQWDGNDGCFALGVEWVWKRTLGVAASGGESPCSPAEFLSSVCCKLKALCECR